jgi:hypothetical protein
MAQGILCCLKARETRFKQPENGVKLNLKLTARASVLRERNNKDYMKKIYKSSKCYKNFVGKAHHTTTIASPLPKVRL